MAHRCLATSSPPWPDAWVRRNQLWEDLVGKQETPVASEPLEVEVRAPSGKVTAVEVHPGLTTPIQLSKGRLARKAKAVACRIDGQLHDLQAPFPSHASTLEWVRADDPEGQVCLQHSSAHLAGAALELVLMQDPDTQYNEVWLQDGPGTSTDFFYDVYTSSPLSADTVPQLQDAVTTLTRIGGKGGSPIERLRGVSREQARQMFADNPYKLQLIDNITHQPQDNQHLSLYRVNGFVDLCAGPHVPHTGFIHTVQLADVSGVETSLTSPTGTVTEHTSCRLTGRGFSSNAAFREWEAAEKERQLRDHRVVGRTLDLFVLHPYCAGKVLWLPAGARLLSRLTSIMQGEYRRHGYQEVRTPLVYDEMLFRISGHWAEYKENMYAVVGVEDRDGHTENASTDHHTSPESTRQGGIAGEKKVLPEHVVLDKPGKFPPATGRSGLKPMNCPGHCLLFSLQQDQYSAEDLPMRWADFSPLHRNERSGALTGLTRLRQFCQDDAHIFALPSHIYDEVTDVLEMIDKLYRAFGFTYEIALSTRPEADEEGAGSLGSDEEWEYAEGVLEDVVKDFVARQDNEDVSFRVDPGEGAFYGPKLDITVRDASDRSHQLGTVQLDFQLPKSFLLSVRGGSNATERPILIHRAILGSLERFVAVLLEHTKGRLPMWCSPRHVAVIPVHADKDGDGCEEFASQVHQELQAAGLYADVLSGEASLAKRVRQAQVKQYNYSLVIGAKEVEGSFVSLRNRDGQMEGRFSVEDIMARFLEEARGDFDL